MSVELDMAPSVVAGINGPDWQGGIHLWEHPHSTWKILQLAALNG
jgi:hypothetical protein